MVGLNNLMPRVLIGCPVSQRHEKVFFEWITNLKNLSYPNFDLCLVDNTLDTKEYYNKIKDIDINIDDSDRKVICMRHKWDPKKQHPIQMLADAREKIRQYAIKEDYDYLFWLDDDIFIPQNGIQKLLSYNKDAVGFYVHVFYEPIQVPCLLKSGNILIGKGLDFFSFDEIDGYKSFVKRFREDKLSKKDKALIPFIIKDLEKPQLFTTYGVNLGCLMTSKKLMNEVPFRTHPSFIYGEDLWFYAEANDKHYEFWCDTDVRPEHKNTEWSSVIKKSSKKMNFFVAYGPSDAKEAEIVERKHG